MSTITALRSSVRPVVTYALVLTQIAVTFLPTVTEQRAQWIFYLTVGAVGWWFGERTLAKLTGKVDSGG